MRDCENCKHRVMKVEVGKGTSSEHFWGCECCECEFEPTTKNNLGVDCISRKAALDITWQDPSYSDPLNVLTEVRDKIRELPPVTPQEPMVIPIAEVKFDEDKLKELVNRAVLTVIPQEPKWIPVSERLPKNRGFYLVSTTDCITIMEFISGWISQNIGLCNGYVKAWMPLPQPYKAESEVRE